jgi:hypothetical protein
MWHRPIVPIDIRHPLSRLMNGAPLIRVVLLTFCGVHGQRNRRKQKQSLNIENHLDGSVIKTKWGDSTLHSNHLQGDKVKGSWRQVSLTFMNAFHLKFIPLF